LLPTQLIDTVGRCSRKSALLEQLLMDVAVVTWVIGAYCRRA
jgi:hypothetical protein